ncbi:uncharacterized protein A1O9_03355 [Exophiala aquamarina CBS 119918]|uniref:Pyruvate dehydrogenase E2 component (Dihydrolipoamide acetyltransferase) n=1 Tax=Exophiala aquamarina CBS 119918 TaxID=1182545 RepID=A0A072Q1Q2_9EURO|nr:uncharacterized protein A1O9_03355 [Exophiala aquamarina CBS 119918]KEF61785.1 hypothetical protein A1O9_03355 [Exophiala aquamarina CBS 119918]
MAARQSVRLLARQITSQCSHAQLQARRTFSHTSTCLAAQNFTMPAMSPTMTEGNISSWKVKEGGSFSSGDVLLEIETDKASMDVEAQEDGIVAKIFSNDGSKGIKVGTRIAVLAEPDDDISSLEIPADDSKPVKSEADNVKGGKDGSYESSGVEKEIKGTPEKKRPAKDRPKTSPTGPGQNPKYPLYPSVTALVHENHLSDEDVAKIPATGPNNRLLKGDVLAFLGTIEQDYPAAQSKRIDDLGHLDLSNIKIQAPATKPPAATPAAPAPEAQIPRVTSIALNISLSEVLKVQKRMKDTLGLSIPLSTFLARAVDLANDDLPLPKGAKPSADDLFNAVLGLDTIPTTSRASYLPHIEAFPISTTPSISRPSRTKNSDLIDILSGKVVRRTAAPLRPAEPVAPGRNITTTGGAVNVFSLAVPVSEEKRARIFLERVKTVLQVEPGRLVL